MIQKVGLISEKICSDFERNFYWFTKI